MNVFVPKKNLGIPRSRMPQIKSTLVPEFIEWIQGQGVGVVRSSVRAAILNATQKELNQGKVEKLADVSNLNHLKKPVIISSDLYLMDGHHRWMALITLDPNAKIAIVRVDLKIKELLDMAQNFSNVSYKDLAACDEWAAREIVAAVREINVVSTSSRGKSKVAESVDFRKYAHDVADRINRKIPGLLPVVVNVESGNTWGSLDITGEDYEKGTRGFYGKLKTLLSRERGLDVESLEKVGATGVVAWLMFKHEEPNPLNGLTKNQATKFVNELIYSHTKGFFTDQSWRPVNSIRDAMNKAQLDWNMTDNNYTHNENGIPEGKNWEFEVRFWNRRGVKTILYGHIRAAGAGSVEDPLEKYDLVAYVN